MQVVVPVCLFCMYVIKIIKNCRNANSLIYNVHPMGDGGCDVSTHLMNASGLFLNTREVKLLGGDYVCVTMLPTGAEYNQAVQRS